MAFLIKLLNNPRKNTPNEIIKKYFWKKPGKKIWETPGGLETIFGEISENSFGNPEENLGGTRN